MEPAGLFKTASRLAAYVARNAPQLLRAADAIVRSSTPCRAGPGFACVNWFGTVYHFTPKQGEIVRKLWRARESGTPAVRLETIAGANVADASAKMSCVFRDHPALGKLIVSASAEGVFQLAEMPGDRIAAEKPLTPAEASRAAHEVAAAFLESGHRLARHAARIAEALSARRHSRGFEGVDWDGEHYVFSPLQAAIVGFLWRAWERGSPDIHCAELLAAAGGQTNKMADVFKNHPAMGRFVVSSAKGVYRLNSQPTETQLAAMEGVSHAGILQAV